MKITNKDLDKKFWQNEDNLLLFEEFLVASVDNHEDYLLMRRQRTAVDVMMHDNFDLVSAYHMYQCPGLSGYSLKSFYLIIEDFKSSESKEIVKKILFELKNKRKKNV